ncbi:Hypothetical protein GLP15_4865 [Giardia lamblia P15]|uniref:Uncharacterized protein n=1 Tax=Giardia intestinalis (strain P15) TaxID=658858 RepID=E1EYA6_GIAIA|nr:Hypothetical protein GLP15_4865 [Giardia lamblia P15]
MISSADQGLDVALQTRAAISDLYVHHLISAGQRLRITTPFKAPNPRPVILVLGEDYSGKSSLISHITGSRLRSEGMCINIYMPCVNDVTYFTDSLAGTLPSIHACFRENGFPGSHIRCSAFNSYSKQTPGSILSTDQSQLQSRFHNANLSPTGKSMYYSTKSTAEGTKQLPRGRDSSSTSTSRYKDVSSNSATLYNSIDKLERSISYLPQNNNILRGTFDQLMGPTCPFIFIEVPFFYRYVIESSASKGILSSLSNLSKRSRQAKPSSLFSKAETRVFENTIKALFHQVDKILFTTSCDLDTKTEGFSVENGRLLHYISSSNELFGKTTILITKCDRLTDKQSCVDAIQECASSLILLSPYRRFKINLVCIPYYCNTKVANQQAKTMRLKQDIYDTIKCLTEQTRTLVDTSNIVLEVTRLSATLSNRPQQYGNSEIEVGALPQLSQEPMHLGISTLTLSADKQDKFLSSSVVPSQQQNYMLAGSLQQSNVARTLAASQTIVNAMAEKLLSQCGTMLRVVNPTTYDTHSIIPQGPASSEIGFGNSLRQSCVSTHRIGELLASTDELCWSLEQSIFADNEHILKDCHAVIVSILRRLEYNIRAVRRIKRKNTFLTLLRILLVTLAILLCFMMASAVQLFGTDFLYTRCHVHHLERHRIFEGGRFDGSTLEVIICVLLYEIGALGLQQLATNTLTMVCIWALVPLLVLMAVFLEALYSTKPLQNDEIASLKRESEYVFKPMLILLDEFLEQKEHGVR